jgi:hypothetical protein
MLSLDDKRWSELKAGYRIPFDARPLLLQLEAGQDLEGTWEQLWGELHHQGDVGEASYAASPHLVRIHRRRGAVDWNTYAIVAVIELARATGKNPDLPGWLEADYLQALRELAVIGMDELPQAKKPEEVRAILSILAIERGARVHGRFLVEYSEEELLDLQTRVLIK